MRFLVWLFLASLAVVLFFQVNPSSLLWLRACVQEPGYTPLSLGDPFTLRALGIMAVCSAALFASLRAVGRRLKTDLTRVPDFLAAENGALIFEFALVFPFILSLVFILFQWAELLMVDRLTHYAAFVAARSAASWAADRVGESRYVINANPGDPKFKKMQDAAAMALQPAMALEGTSVNKPTVKLLDVEKAEAVTKSELQVVKRKRFEHVGVEVIWGLKPRWPVVGLFFKPMLEDGRIPITRSYRVEIEPYVESDTRFPFDMVFREEKARQALHKKVYPGNHREDNYIPTYHAAEVTKRKLAGKKNDTSECMWIGIAGPEPCCPNNKGGVLGQLVKSNPYGAGVTVPPQ